MYQNTNQLLLALDSEVYESVNGKTITKVIMAHVFHKFVTRWDYVYIILDEVSDLNRYSINVFYINVLQYTFLC